ncbi:hypothetical protein C1645_846653 [Glomus cerebriforme]|uniref:CsbD-like domain-containing protein n=1 Tax=Glomus cerebriforme TaxID=658196 RepID=A0A397TAF0_9GLOM|nr:hypothetical protein C1645_846653 [Glomus cerebriforme]
MSTKIPGGYPVTPEHEKNAGNNMGKNVETEQIPGGYPVTPEHEKNLESNNVEKQAEETNRENYEENNVGKQAEENSVEKQAEENNVGKQAEENNVGKQAEENNVGKQAEENNVGKQAEENNVESKAEENNVESKAEENNVESKAGENNVENKDEKNNNVENNAEAKNVINNAVESFPLKFYPDPSKKPADDNNIAKATTNKGSSALGGIGINPATLLGIGSDSPPHPFYQDKSQESEPEPQPQAFDLNGDYNEQKEKEQIADQQEQGKPDHRSTERHQQKSAVKKDERIDLGVKPLGNQPLPLPYKPEEGNETNETKAPTGNTDHSVHKQTEGAKRDTVPPGKATAVHPESQDLGHRVTKKDKINATIGKAVGTLKEKVGKLVKNDNLVARGTEKKAEADQTKELAEVQKKMNEM